jgi:hypothetical protein
MATITQIRTLVDDYAGSNQIYNDDHYQIIIDIEDNVYRAASTAARTLAAYFAEKVSTQAGPVSNEAQQKFEHYISLSESYDQRAREGGGSVAGDGAMAPALSGTSYSDIESNNSDTDRYAGSFYRGMDSNPPVTEIEDVS